MQSAVFLLCAIVLLCISTYTAPQAYTVTTPYQYPVRPGSDEWRAMQTNSEMVAACQIPEELMKEMTTDALLDSVLDYPLLADLYVYRSIDTGLQQMCTYFDALPEFVSRKDAFTTVQQKLDAFAEVEEDTFRSDARALLERDLLNCLLAMTGPA